MLTTWGELINVALIELNVLDEGAILPQAEQNRALQRLKMMLQEWNLDELLRFGEGSVRYTATTSSKYEFKVGMDRTPPADINIYPPDRIQNIRYRRSGETHSFNLGEIGLSRWSRNQDEYSTCPSQFYYDRDHPVATLRFNGSMLSGDYFDIYTKDRFDVETIGLSDEVEYPDGYYRAVMMNLAVELSPSYGVQPERTTHMAAMRAKKLIRQRNSDYIRTDFRDLARMSGGVNGRRRGSRGRGSY